MRKIVAVINLTLDGFCDHTAVTPDDETHHFFTELLKSADAILFGRTTYHLMEYWRTVLEHPTGNKSMDEFATTIDQISKIVFSHSLKNLDWQTATVAKHTLEQEIATLKQQPGRDILLASPSLIAQCTNLNLIDEYQILLHPVILGTGLPLFKNLTEKVNLKLLKTKTFNCGAIALYYAPAN